MTTGQHESLALNREQTWEYNRTVYLSKFTPASVYNLDRNVLTCPHANDPNYCCHKDGKDLIRRDYGGT